MANTFTSTTELLSRGYATLNLSIHTEDDFLAGYAIVGFAIETATVFSLCRVRKAGQPNLHGVRARHAVRDDHGLLALRGNRDRRVHRALLLGRH